MHVPLRVVNVLFLPPTFEYATISYLKSKANTCFVCFFAFNQLEMKMICFCHQFRARPVGYGLMGMTIKAVRTNDQ
jgi:heme/copper-type cytochrome/quinol oxidase subunit 4